MGQRCTFPLWQQAVVDACQELGIWPPPRPCGRQAGSPPAAPRAPVERPPDHQVASMVMDAITLGLLLPTHEETKAHLEGLRLPLLALGALPPQSCFLNKLVLLLQQHRRAPGVRPPAATPLGVWMLPWSIDKMTGWRRMVIEQCQAQGIWSPPRPNGGDRHSAQARARRGMPSSL